MDSGSGKGLTSRSPCCLVALHRSDPPIAILGIRLPFLPVRGADCLLQPLVSGLNAELGVFEAKFFASAARLVTRCIGSCRAGEPNPVSTGSC